MGSISTRVHQISAIIKTKTENNPNGESALDGHVTGSIGIGILHLRAARRIIKKEEFMVLVQGTKTVASALIVAFLSMFLSQCAHSHAHCDDWIADPGPFSRSICRHWICDEGYHVDTLGPGECQPDIASPGSRDIHTSQ